MSVLSRVASAVVVITIRGGTVQEIVSDNGVRVVVLDFDVQGVAAEELHYDDDGVPYREIVW